MFSPATLSRPSGIAEDCENPTFPIVRAPRDSYESEIAADHDSYFDGFPPELSALRDQVLRVAPQDTTLLLTGETGTGKTRLARLIHDMSRGSEPFLIVDCGALSPSLIESEMFGHVKGAFTGADRERLGKFAAAGRGTLVLDEINSLPLTLQSKLLRVVEDRLFEPVGSNRSVPLHARIIAVSNAPLEEEVKAGRFRADLFFRLDVVGFYMPTLQSRQSSIMPLCRRFLEEFAGRNRPDVRGIEPDAMRALHDYHWPGNIRELRNVIERAIALCPGPSIQLSDLPEAIRLRCTSAAGAAISQAPRDMASSFANMTLAESKELTEIQRIKEVLAKHRNNRLRAARELGISRMGLYKKLHKYGLIQRTNQQPDPALAR